MKKANIESLPRVNRELIEAAIVRENFSNYAALAEKFKGFGKGVSKSGIHRHAQKLKRFQEAVRFEAEMMRSFSEPIQWLITWAKRNPREAALLVARLQRKQAQFSEGRQ